MIRMKIHDPENIYIFYMYERWSCITQTAQTLIMRKIVHTTVLQSSIDDIKLSRSNNCVLVIMEALFSYNT